MRAFQQFLALRPISALMARLLHHADTLLLRLSRGKLTFAQLSGLPIIELTTTLRTPAHQQVAQHRTLGLPLQGAARTQAVHLS